MLLDATDGTVTSNVILYIDNQNLRLLFESSACALSSGQLGMGRGSRERRDRRLTERRSERSRSELAQSFAFGRPIVAGGEWNAVPRKVDADSPQRPHAVDALIARNSV